MDQARYPPYWIGSGKAAGQLQYMDHLLTFDRANTTCKTHAFGGPRWAQARHFWGGDMSLSERETKLIEAYERHGRAYLADCVRNARVHQLLDSFFGTDFYTPSEYLHDFLSNRHAMRFTLDPGSISEEFLHDREAMKSAIHPGSPREMWTLIYQWEAETKEKYEGDEGLALVKELNRRQLEARSRSRIVYPFQRMMRRSWKRCRKVVGMT